MTMGALSWPSTNLIVLHHILRSPSPSSLLSLLIFKPFPNPLQRQTPPFSSAASFQYPSSHRRLTCSASKSNSNSNPNKVFLEHSNDVVLSDDYEKTENEEYEEFDAEKETASAGEGLERVLDVPVVSETEVKIKLPVPILTAKEKKELASFAHSLGKKLKSQQVGKSGVTDSVTTALIESLEANELLKLKIHGTCPGELDDVVKQLEEGTGSVIVGQIGRTVILYRPSLTKLKAEEKKKQVGRVHVRTKSPYNTLLQNIGQGPRLSGRGRRGSSRV